VRLAAGLVAVAICAVITTLKLNGAISSLAGCGAAGGCEAALGGRWSQWLGIPVTLPALFIHLGIIALCPPAAARLLSPQTRSRLLTTAAFSLIIAALWFIGLIASGTRGTAWCPWCLAAHSCGLITAIILLARPSAPTSLALPALAATAVAATLILGQLFGPQPESHQLSSALLPPLTTPTPTPAAPTPAATSPTPAPAPTAPATTTAALPPNTRAFPGSPNPPRLISFPSSQAHFDAANLPILGNPNAPTVFVEYFDYTCKSCRELYEDLNALKAAYPDQFAVVVIPCPLNRACNPNLLASIKDHESACDLAKLGLAVWRLNPSVFPRFHEGLLKLPLPASVPAATALAETAIPADQLKAELNSKPIADFLAAVSSDYARLASQSPAMPKLLIKDKVVMHGLPSSTKAFIDIIAKQFSLPQKSAPALLLPPPR
jgi:protein-disulfide isomerase